MIDKKQKISRFPLDLRNDQNKIWNSLENLIVDSNPINSFIIEEISN